METTSLSRQTYIPTFANKDKLIEEDAIASILLHLQETIREYPSDSEFKLPTSENFREHQIKEHPEEEKNDAPAGVNSFGKSTQEIVIKSKRRAKKSARNPNACSEHRR